MVPGFFIVGIFTSREKKGKKTHDDFAAGFIHAGDEYLGSGYDEYSKPQSVTEAKALKMISVYADKLRQEIQAVEFVYNGLRLVEQRITQKLRIFH